MSNYIVEKREPGSNWYRYSSTSSEYGATVMAESAKKVFPNATFRVLDDKGSVRFIT